MKEANVEELARRAVACKHWRWMPGMRWCVDRPVPLDSIVGRIGDLASEMYPGALPDLTDPATLGCLLALVREAQGQDDIGAYRFEDGWIALASNRRIAAGTGSWDGDTEAAALVAALEAAP